LPATDEVPVVLMASRGWLLLFGTRWEEREMICGRGKKKKIRRIKEKMFCSENVIQILSKSMNSFLLT
jgi:hypothetical protein